jgi:hypothetical protein
MNKSIMYSIKKLKYFLLISLNSDRKLPKCKLAIYWQKKNNRDVLEETLFQEIE